MTTLKWYRVLCIFVMYFCLSSQAWSAPGDGRILVAWGLWNEPADVSSSTSKAEPKETRKPLEAATQQAAIAKKEALQALRKFEESRRLAQETEARRLALEQKTQDLAEAQKLQEQAARERALMLAEQRKAEMEKLQQQQAAREQEQAELEKLQQQAAREREQAELEKLQQQAAREREQAELDRLREAAAQEQNRMQEERRLAEQQQREAAAAPTQLAMMAAPAAGTEVAPALPAVSTAGPADYVIGPGDVLDAAVWKDDSLTRTVIVSPDGTFSFPLIGDVLAAGRTLPELKAELEQKISQYVPDPVFTLEMKQTNSMQIYVLGKVNSPGRYAISSHVNVLQALAMAGGLNPFADEDDIRIMREGGGGQTLNYDFNYKKVLRGDNLEQNIRLQRGDVIVIP